MKQLYFVVFLFITSFSIAQTDSTKVKNDSLITVLTDPTTTENFLKNTSIASPTAAALGKYADVPINYNTGLPAISLPITVVKGSQLSLPISFSYHGGGHKVADIASWVGLGWSLNAGGIITRQVMGGPDESWGGNKGVLPDLSIITSGNSVRSGFYNDYGFSLPRYDGNNPDVSLVKLNTFKCAGIGYYDTEPDVFSFNIGGMAGKFYFDASRKAHFIPEQDFKVEVIYLGNPTYEFETFILTAPDGTRYYFGGSAYEKSTTSSGYGSYSGSYLKSSWYLYKIESADRLDSILLDYTDEAYTFLNVKSERYEQGTETSISPNPWLPYFADNTNIEGKRLSQITSSQHQVNFYAATPREDVNPTHKYNPSMSFDVPKRLDSVVIRSVLDANEAIKFVLNYSYFQAIAPTISGTFEYELWAGLNGGAFEYDKKRLRLDSVQEVSKDGTLSKPSTVFTYDTTPLPRRLSMQRDHWGYYNGQTTNRSFVADASYILPTPNREANWVFMKAGHLMGITYPTGGRIDFNFEPNYLTNPIQPYIGGYIGGLRIASMVEHFTSSQEVTTTYSYETPRQPLPLTDYSFFFENYQPYSNWLADFATSWSQTTTPEPFISKCNEASNVATLLRIFSSSLYSSVGAFIGTAPTYGFVRTHKIGNGFTDYVYEAIYPKQFFNNTYPFSSGELVNYVNNGKLLTETYYNEQNQLQKRFTYTYNSLPDVSAETLVTAYHWERVGSCSPGVRFAYTKYSYPKTRSLLLSKTETNYNLSGTNSVSKTTHYDYGTNHQQPIREAFLASNGDSLITRSVYVHDYNLPPLTTTSYVPDPDISELQVGTCRQMQTANQNELVERVNYIKKIGSTTELAIGGRFFGYSWYAFAGKKGAVSTLFLSQPKNHTLSYYNPAAYEIYHDKLTYELRSISSYNLGSGLLAYEKQTKNSSSGSDGPLNYYTWYPNGLLDSKIVYSPNSFSLGLQTSYTHSSLFGVTSITQPFFSTQRFIYDKLGRLSQIRDNLNMIENQFSYYYGASNYVKTQSPHYGNYTLPLNANYPTTTYQYVDGLGRPTQTIDKNGSPVSGLDIVTQTQTYDNVGRPLKKYLPFALANWGHEVTPPSLIQGDQAGFSEVSLYDNSPLNRPLQHFGAGKAWRDTNKFTAVAYEVNDGSIRLYRVDNQGAVTSSLYAAGVLYETTKTDEAGHQSIDYTDKEGRLIQRLVQDGESSYQTTAYIYDDLGRLRYVVQPEGFANAASFTTNSSVFTDYIFGYRYDGRGRVIAKHVPNGGWTRTVYDVIDRPVLEQTPLQALENKWTFHKYDGLGREIMQGEKVLNDSHEVLQQTVYDWTYIFEDLGTDIKGYTNRTLVVAESEVQSINYYSVGAYPVVMPTHVFWQQAHYWARGILVEQQHRNGNVFDTYRSYYNSRNQLIYDTYEHTGTPAFSLKSSYDPAFQGEMKRIQRIFERGGSRDTLRQAWTYDESTRPLTYAESINSPVLKLIANYQYDSIGRLQQKKFLPNGTYYVGGIPDYINRPPSPNVGIDDVAKKAICLLPGTQITNTYSATIDPNGAAGTPISGLQTMDYRWHIRGGLRGINLDGVGNAVPNANEGDLFSYKLDYESQGQWDGNIGKQTWKNDTEIARSYTYTYDPAKRLKTATYTGVGTENYSLPNMSFDKNGNITNLQRNGKNGTSFGMIDNLNYSYSGNRLLGVTDAISGNEDVGDFRDNGSSSDYTYWADGSLKSDANKGISLIEYDTFLKKVKQVNWSNGNWLKFFYDGSGKLLKRQNSMGDVWEYVGAMVFKNGVPYQLSTPEGRAVYSNGNGSTPQWNYEFEYRDVWGNLRQSFAAEGNQLVSKQKSDYDALGYEFNKVAASPQNNYKYQKQERIDDFNLGIDFFKYRPSDYQIGRFWQIDPLAEKYVYNSPYALQENKFGLGVELEGLELQPFYPSLQTEMLRSVGYDHVPNNKESYSLAKDLSIGAAKIYAGVMLMFLPVEELAIGGLGIVAKEIGLGAKVESAVAKEMVTVEKGADFIVTPKGTAVPTSQSRMKEGFKQAEFPKTPTNSKGAEYTLQDGRKVRTMEATSNAPKRASFENKNGQPVDPDGKTVQPPKGLNPSERKEYIRERTHVKQN